MELLDDKIRVWTTSAQYVKPIAGVYVLYNRNKDPIYIGESENLEKRFSKYIDTEFEGDECKQKTSSYQRVFAENPKVMQLQLIEDFKNKTGNIPSCNVEIKVKTH